MVSIVNVWTRMNQLAKSGTSGYDDQDQFNSKAAAVSLMIPELLIPDYEDNKRVAEALAMQVTVAPATSDAAGQVTKPSGFLHLLDLGLKLNGQTYPSRPLRLNGLNRLRQNSVRRRNTAEGKIAHYLRSDAIFVEPNEVMDLELCFLRKPATPGIVLTPAGDADSDYLTATPDQDFEFPEQLFNLIVYLMLEQFGVEMKEQLLVEYAQLGLTRAIASIKPQPKN